VLDLLIFAQKVSKSWSLTHRFKQIVSKQ